ncbi:MAG: sulfatase-like hydrolase/transferase [candidate division Zixibacteria bacterium]|nr:sulfatase-like hydrolase/transferase [candidate division Zixibacteria bacterium]
MFKILFSNLKVSITSGLFAGLFIGILDSIVISILSSFVWIPAEIYIFPVLGIIVSIPLGITVSILLMIFEKLRRYRRWDIFYFSLIASLIAFPVIPELIIKSLIDPGSSPTYSIILSILLFAGFYFVANLVSIYFRKMISPLRINWRTAGIIISLIIFLVLKGLTVLFPINKEEFEKYDISKTSQLKNNPNIIFIIIDTLRYDCLSVYDKENRTPNIQNLTDDGITFANAFVNCSWTKPSIASIITSLYTNQHNVQTEWDMINPQLTTLAQVLQDVGYYTVGFHTNGHLNTASNFHKGYNLYKGYYSYNEGDPRLPEFRLAKQYRRLDMLFMKLLKQRGPIRPGHKDAVELNEIAIDWLSDNQDKKYFMFLHFMDPHYPYRDHPYTENVLPDPIASNAGNDSADKYLEKYKGEVEFVDSGLGMLFDYLKETNKYDNTLIVITSDHGEEFYDHSGWGHGLTLYDEQLRCPLLFKLPNSLDGGRVDSSFIESVDISPSIVNYAGFKPPKEWEGNDVFNDVRVNWSFGKTIRKHVQAKGIRSLSEKYCLYNLFDDTISQIHYYNLKDDPLEKINLADNPDYKERIAALNDSLLLIENGLALKAVKAGKAELDEETIRQLKALGYLQ